MTHYHHHTTPKQLTLAGSKQTYGVVVGTVENSTERPIQGRNGDHLQFYLNIGGGRGYQVDVNTQSRDGTQIGLYIAEEPLNEAEPPPGPTNDAALSYKGIGLTDADFVDTDYTRIESQLKADLVRAQTVVAYGLMFDDGGPEGLGIHETHYTGYPNQDGALSLHIAADGSTPAKRLWYFFKFRGDDIP